MKLAKTIWFVFILLFLAFILGVAWFMTLSYDFLIEFAIQELQRPDLKEALEQRFFTNQKFLNLQRASYSIIPVGLAVLGYFIVKRKMIVRGVYDILRKIYYYSNLFVEGVFKSNSKIKILFVSLLLLVLIRSVYYALYFYPQYDECWNYNYFLSNNFFTTFFAYNNYPLHNILSYGTLSLLPDSTFSMRLPNIFLGLLNMVLIYYLILRIFKNEKIALASSAIFSVLPTIVFYFLFARGVMLAITFSILLLFFFLTKNIERWTKADIFLVAILGALGNFSMISFPIFLLAIFAFTIFHSLYQGKGQTLRKLGYTALWLSVFTSLLYLPMFFGTSFELALHSQYTQQAFSWELFWLKTGIVSKDQIGFTNGAFIFIGINFLLLFFSNRKRIIGLSLLLILIPFALALASILIPARSIGFQILGYLFTLIVLLELCLKSMNTRVFTAISLLLIIAWNYKSTHHTFFDWSSRPDRGAYELAKVFQENNISSFYDIEGKYHYFVPSLLYHHKLKGKEIKYYTSNTNSARYQKIENYTGDAFLAPMGKQDSSTMKILYRYKDESNAFILFQLLPNPPSEAL